MKKTTYDYRKLPIKRRGDKALAEREWKTISKKSRKVMGLSKEAFIKEFLEELYYIRRKKR